nr:MarR family winged helix-turn-helix transcriptional regulator [Rhizobium sp. BK196]
MRAITTENENVSVTISGGAVPIELTASQALGLWHGVALDQVRHDNRDLTLRQMAILLHIYLVPPPHTVRGLAATLNVTKPVITRALDTMGEMGLVDRVRDDDDRRNVIIKRTVGGALYLEKLGDLVREQGRKLPV